MKKQKGFTLIELLVVISIIILLTSIALAALTNARQKSEDTAKIRSIQEVRTALQMYFTDYGYYPGNNSWITDLTAGSKKYIAAISNGLIYSGSTGSALCTAKCNSYHLGAVLKLDNKVLSGDKDLTLTGDTFVGAGPDCLTSNPSNDRCYDITP